MRSRGLFLVVLSLALIASGLCHGDFRFVSWADNRPGDAANRARFQWALSEMDLILGGDPMIWEWHIVPGDFDPTSVTREDLNNHSMVSSWAYAPGNHEDSEAMSQPNTSWDYENVHFVFLNEYCCGDGDICDHVYDWLVNDLNNNTQPAVFVVGHEPAYPENRHVGDSLDAFPANRDRFWRLLNDRGVLAYICGHTHVYSTFSNAMGSTMQIDVGNAGNPSIPGNSQTFVVFDVHAQDVEVSVYSGLENEAYTGGYSFSLLIPEPIYTAHDPTPANGAQGVPTNTELSWAPGSGAISHDVYLWKQGFPPALVSQQQPGTSYACDLEPETLFFWRVDEHFADGISAAGDTWSFTTKPAYTLCYVAGETSIDGVVDGVGKTDDSDNRYESITEELNVPNKNGYSALKHRWQFNVPPGQYVQFRVEAHHSPSADGDDFTFSYSTDAANYTGMLTITKTADDDAERVFSLPADLSGTVYVMAEDTEQTKGSQATDTLFIDCMYIVSSDVPYGGPPEYKATNPSPADAATGAATNVTLTWTPGDEAISHTIYLGTSVDTLVQEASGLTVPSYGPLSLSSNTTYYWRVDEERAGGETEVGTVWSFATAAGQSPVANAGSDKIVIDDGDGVETVQLDGTNSSDSDGTIVSFEWDVGDDGSVDRTGPTVAYDFGIGTHVVVLTVTDNDGLTDSDDVTVTVQAQPSGATMHVASMTGVANLRGNSGQWAALVTVTVRDQDNSPVFGATVSGNWSGGASGTSTGVTASDGTVTLSSKNMKEGITATFTIADVTHASLTYDSDASEIEELTVYR